MSAARSPPQLPEPRRERREVQWIGDCKAGTGLHAGRWERNIPNGNRAIVVGERRVERYPVRRRIGRDMGIHPVLESQAAEPERLAVNVDESLTDVDNVVRALLRAAPLASVRIVAGAAIAEYAALRSMLNACLRDRLAREVEVRQLD